MKIQKLPPQVRSKLQSGLIVTDAVQCVLELVHNSLDAEATGIAVRVDLKAYEIRVIDNGKGIDKDDLEFVGERFMTSKYHPSVETETSFPTYGFKGQALSSLQEVSRSLTIETKSEDGGPTFVKVFQNSKALPITDIDNSRNGTGTIVTINDFLYTMPIRRKRIREVFDIEEIKAQLQYLAVIHYNVSFTLRNENKNLILLQTAQTSSVLESFTNMYGKTIAKSLKALHGEEKKFEVSGFISLKPQSQNNIQLIYINQRVITKGVIHKFVNSLIKEYSGKKNLSDELTGHLLKNFKSFHNVFILQIKCPHSYYELFTNLRKSTVEFKNWKVVLKCIHRAVKQTFKTVLNLDSSTNVQDEDENEIEKKEGRKAFGTSLLVNAVKGIPARRALDVKINKNANKRKGMKMNDRKEKSHLLLLKNVEDKGNGRHIIDSSDTEIFQNRCTNDTFESPIPKKTFRSCEWKFKKPSFSQSFVEFFEWLKAKFETDTNAFNLYNDFLQFKKGMIHSQEFIQFKSPVVGGKLKRKQPLKQKSVTKKQKTPSKELSVLDKEKTIVCASANNQQQLKIFPNQNLTMKRAIQFTTETSSFSKTFNLDLEFVNKNENFRKNNCKELFKKPEGFCVNRTQKERNKDLPSLSSSEVQFVNAIKFRNLPDGFCQSFGSHMEVHPEKSFCGSNTWTSHYENFRTRSPDLREQQQNVKYFAPWMETLQKNKNLEFDCSDGWKLTRNLVEGTQKAKEAKDIEVQVNMSILPAKKVNCTVQTSQEILLSPNFVNSCVLNQENGKKATKKVQKDQMIASQNILVEEVSNPDFWNTSPYMLSDKVNNSEFVVKDKTSNKSSNDLRNNKNSASSEFVCGHKSHASTKPESPSKDTQTLAAIWSESLSEMEDLTERDKVGNTNSKSDGAQAQFTSIPNTLIQDTSGHIESDFRVSERHDFVPKGLSPRLINPERTEISSLSPSKKCKIKKTIDDRQNDLLATIKWQDESTGDCLKPTIPDGIFFDMRQKAEENFKNYENPVLSGRLSCCAVKVHNLLHSFVFTKDLLSSVEVLGQWDKKFIVTKMKVSAPKEMELISLFDQHAADERIKLEELVNENINPDGKFVSSPVTPPVECALGESYVRVFADLKEKILNFGFRTNLVGGNTISITEAPTFLLRKHKSDVKNKKDTTLSDIVKAVIENIIQELKETRGAASRIPKYMHNAFCLEACRKAIKFNKQLSLENMTEMINKLQNCKLPFQCAHGRPSVIPIIDLKDFKPTEEEIQNIDYQKFKKFFNDRKESGGIVDFQICN